MEGGLDPQCRGWLHPIRSRHRHKRRDEEERRLLYVAMTRAKDELNLIVPQRFYTYQQARSGDRHVYAGRSRFIPASLCEHFRRVIWPAAPREQVRPPATNAAIDIRERMRRMWSKAT